MHIGIISTRSPRYHPNRRLIAAAGACGHEASVIDLKTCLCMVESGQLDVVAPFQIERVDAFLTRIGAAISDYGLTLVRHLELTGARVINGFKSILLSRDKFFGIETLAHRGIPVPQTFLVRDFKDFQRAVAKLDGYPVIVKTLNSMQGRGVMLVESARMAEFITSNIENRSAGLLVQAYFPPYERRDIRVFVIGAQVAAAMERKPRKGDFRSNIHLGGKASPLVLERGLEELAIKSSAVLGLEISGVDILLDAKSSPKVIEVNYSPGFRGLEAATGLDIASKIVQYVTQTLGGAL